LVVGGRAAFFLSCDHPGGTEQGKEDAHDHQTSLSKESPPSPAKTR
jgi:hypothetical protein